MHSLLQERELDLEGNIMTFLSTFGQMVLLTTVLFHLTASLPLWESNQENLQGIITNEIRRLNIQSVFARNYVDALIEARLRNSSLQRRQLGDIEFSNRYAEYLRSKAKHTSICAFLRRMQNVKKSGMAGETEKVNLLLKQYMCPNVYNWAADF